MKDNKNLIKNIVKGILCIFLFFESGYLQVLLKYLLHINNVTSSIAAMLNFMSNGIFCLFLILVYRKELVHEFKIYKKKFTSNIDIGIKYWMIGLFGMMVSNILINVLFGSGVANNEQAVQKMISAFPVLMIINAGIIAPINEEILFRKCFKNVIKNKYVFILTSGIFFGFLHVSSATNLAQFLYIIPYSCLGLAFATMYVKTDSVFTSMFMHMFHNTVLTIVSILI